MLFTIAAYFFAHRKMERPSWETRLIFLVRARQEMYRPKWKEQWSYILVIQDTISSSSSTTPEILLRDSIKKGSPQLFFQVFWRWISEWFSFNLHGDYMAPINESVKRKSESSSMYERLNVEKYYGWQENEGDVDNIFHLDGLISTLIPWSEEARNKVDCFLTDHPISHAKVIS